MTTQNISKDYLSTADEVSSPAVTKNEEEEEDSKTVSDEGDTAELMEVDSKEENEEKEEAKDREEEERRETPLQGNTHSGNEGKGKCVISKRQSHHKQLRRRRTKQGKKTLGLTK